MNQVESSRDEMKIEGETKRREEKRKEVALYSNSVALFELCLLSLKVRILLNLQSGATQQQQLLPGQFKPISAWKATSKQLDLFSLVLWNLLWNLKAEQNFYSPLVCISL